MRTADIRRRLATNQQFGEVRYRFDDRDIEALLRELDSINDRLCDIAATYTAANKFCCANAIYTALERIAQ